MERNFKIFYQTTLHLSLNLAILLPGIQPEDINKKHKNAVIICMWIKWIIEALFVVAKTGNLPKHF